MNFEFGIGITASDEGANEAIGGVISEVGNLETSMSSISGDDTFMKMFGDISETLRIISEDTGRLAGAFGDLDGAGEVIGTVVEDVDDLGKEMCGVVVCIDDAVDASGELGSALAEVPQKAKTIGEQFQEVGAAAGMLSSSGSQLRRIFTRINRSMGDTALQADLTASSVLKVANANKVAWKEVATLRARMAGAAIDIDMSTKAGQRQMKTMVLLKESFELTDDQIQSLAGTMKATGGSLTKLSGIAVQFQKKFRVPGLINELPKAAKAAMNAQAQFGSLVGKSSRDITTNIMRMTGTYARALGVTAAEAADKARGTFLKFTGEVESFEDLFLGLSDSFTPLQTAFLETGISMEDMEDLMRKGAESPAEFAEEVKRIRDSLDPQMGQRFFRQVLRNTDEATKLLLTQEEAAKNATEAAAGAGAEPEDPSATFDKIAKAMRENAVDAEGMHQALKGVAVETAKLAADEGVRQGLEVINDGFQMVNTALIDTYEGVRQNEAVFQSYNKVIGATTAALVGLSDAYQALFGAGGKGGIIGGAAVLLGGVGSAFGLVTRGAKFAWAGINKLWKLFRGGGGATKGATAGIKGIGKTLGKIALPIGIAIAAFDGIVQAVKGVGSVLTDDTKTWPQKIIGVWWEIQKGVFTAIDSFLFGLPGKFIEGFKNLGGQVSTEGASSLGKAFGKVLGTILRLQWEFWTDTVPTFFKETAIPAIGKAISALGEPEFWLGILTGIAAVGDQILAFFKGVGVGILEGFGMTTKEAEAQMDVLAAAFGLIGAEVTMFFSSMFSGIGQIADTQWFLIKEGFFAVRDAMVLAGAFITDSLSGNFDGIKMRGLEMAKSLVEALSLIPGMGEEMDGLAEKIDKNMLAIQARGKESASETSKVIKDLDKERAARQKAFDEKNAQYDADKAARQKVITDKEKELEDAVKKQLEVQAAVKRGDVGSVATTADQPPVVASKSDEERADLRQKQLEHKRALIAAKPGGLDYLAEFDKNKQASTAAQTSKAAGGFGAGLFGGLAPGPVGAGAAGAAAFKEITVNLRSTGFGPFDEWFEKANAKANIKNGSQSAQGGGFD